MQNWRFYAMNYRAFYAMIIGRPIVGMTASAAFAKHIN